MTCRKKINDDDHSKRAQQQEMDNFKKIIQKDMQKKFDEERVNMAQIFD